MITLAEETSISQQWVRWGVGFNCEASEEPVDLEQLFVDTAAAMDDNPRLIVMTVTWLARYYHLVDVSRLAELAKGLQGRDSARLGLLLESSYQHIPKGTFDPVLAVCRPWRPVEPLYDFMRENPELAAIYRGRATKLSLKWGLWTEEIDRLKFNALRPAHWIAAHNPTFTLRALLKNDVRCRVMTTLIEQRLGPLTETQLTKHVGCTRRAMHLALVNLESAGLIRRKREGRNYAITAVDLAAVAAKR